MRPAVREALLYGSAPPWLLPGLPSFQMDWNAGRLWLNGIAYYDEASIIGQCSSFSTPSHYETDVDGVLQLVGANRLSAFAMTPGKCRGQLVEEARTNVVLYSNDLTQTSAWTASNITTAKDQTGPDGVANSASSITAGANNGTILQAITLASSARFQSAYVKRITGSGTVSMTMDNGSTYTAVTVTASWSRVSIPTQTLANPTVGFKLATSGDKIAVWGVQNENGTYSTSPIATTSTQVTRAASDIRRTLGSEFGTAQGTLLAQFQMGTLAASRNALLIGAPSVTTDFMAIYYNGTAASFRSRRAGTTTDVLLSSTSVNTTLKVAAAYQDSNYAAAMNGGAAVTASATVPTSNITTAFFGQNMGFGTDYLNGPLARVAFFKTRLPDSQLAGLTQ